MSYEKCVMACNVKLIFVNRSKIHVENVHAITSSVILQSTLQHSTFKTYLHGIFNATFDNLVMKNKDT